MPLRPLALAACLAALPAGASACAMKLLFALDSSASVDRYEQTVQRTGIAAAFLDEEVQAAIANLGGPLWVALSHWSGRNQQTLSLDWTRIESAADATALAARIEALRPPALRSSTAIGRALAHADQVLAAGPECGRTVIDLSGDGPSNTGPGPAPVADALAAEGVTINGLLINVNPSHFPGGDGIGYFRDQIVRGAGAFVMTADNWRDYPDAFRRKLLRELQPQLAQH